MTIINMFHYGVLVHDLDAAIDRFGEVHGFTFNPPTPILLRRMVYLGKESPLSFRATYSKQGPPYIELIEASGDGFYRAEQGEGPHHLAFWDPDLAMNKAQYLEHKNLKLEAEILTPEGQPFAWYSKPEGAHGTRFEFIDEAARPDIEEWIRTGISAGGDFVV